jgi:hypothetical protein
MALKTTMQHSARVALVLLTIFSAITPSAVARARHNKAPEPLVTVVAHLALPGPPATQTSVQEYGRHQYLFIEQSSKEGVTIVDVTKPSQPKVIKQVAWPNQAAEGKLQLVGAGLAFTTAPEANSGSTGGSSQTRSLNWLDLRDPAHPQTIQGFSGVTSVFLDESRDLMYITNHEGLWILRYKQEELPTLQEGCPAGRASTDPNCSN